MEEPETDRFYTKRSVAVLADVFVRTASENDSTFKARFLKQLDGAYRVVRDKGQPVTDELELLEWVRSVVTGKITGVEGKPHLDPSSSDARLLGRSGERLCPMCAPPSTQPS
jgi:hypothetical protein